MTPTPTPNPTQAAADRLAVLDVDDLQRLAALELERQTKQLQVEVSEAVMERLLREVAGEVRRIDERRGVAGSEY